jgi:adenylate cyclase
MPTSTAPSLPLPRSQLFAGSLAQRLRILSGLVLFAFVLMHFLNHALGIWSAEAMDAMQAWRTAVTRSPVGTVVLGTALAIHLGLALARIAQRSTWRMPVWEAVQILLGLAIVPLLIPHALPMRGKFDVFGADTLYSETLAELWTNLVWTQTALLLVVWVHACIGLHFWLRLSRAYRRLAPLLLALAVLVPALALVGFLVAGREAAERRTERAAAADQHPAPAAATEKSSGDRLLADLQLGLFWACGGVAGAGLAWFGLRALRRRAAGGLRVQYTAGPTLRIAPGPTLLEISRSFGVPHVSICGGRARCSTCRVRVEEVSGDLPPPSGAEAATLERIRADPTVRLACQLRPRGDMTVTRLVRLPEAARALVPTTAEDVGVERTLAILFLDIRGFTALSDARLPYDTVFLLNRFFAEVGEAVTGAGGWIDKYLGDGLMALFGLNGRVEDACRSALVAAMRVDAALEKLNAELHGELSSPLKIGIGLHVGPLVLGRIGHRGSASTTVIGPAVNVASRLESLTKEHGVQIVASAALAEAAGLRSDDFAQSVVSVRGASEAMSIVLIARGRDLRGSLGDEGLVAAAGNAAPLREAAPS